MAELEAALASHESQLAAAHEAQRTSIAMLSARGRTTAGEEGEGAAAELRRQLEEERRAHSSEVAGLNTQVGGRLLSVWGGPGCVGSARVLFCKCSSDHTGAWIYGQPVPFSL